MDMHGCVNGNPEIDFVPENLIFCGGLEQVMRYLRRIGWNGQLLRR